jgi:hypothetical protein
VVGLADPLPPPDLDAHPSADALLDAVEVDVLVVATPTPTHADVVDSLRRRWSGPIVVEKPAATTRADVARLLDDEGVDLLYHAAFAPEVEWAATHLARWSAEHGGIAAIDQRFADAYAADLERATATLGNSWLDGGINALSVLARLVDLDDRCRVVPVDGLVSTSVASLSAGDVAIELVTTWAAAEPAKRTDIRFADRARLVLDHQAIQGRIGDEWFASPGPPRRLVQHYAACYTRRFVAGRRSFPVEVDRVLHRLLLG